MNINLSNLDERTVYSIMTQCIIPRPVAWVLSDNGDGGYNLAPFFYFNAVCSDSTMIMISAGRKRSDRERKDTWCELSHFSRTHSG